jgi:hypothetical protein
MDQAGRERVAEGDRGESVSLLTERTEPRGSQPAISVAVPVLDGGPRLVTLVRAVLDQVVEAGPVEILLADTGSTDGAVREAARAHPAIRVFDVAPGRFDHGLVRTELVRAARGPLVALLSQDAVPRGRRYLEALAAPFVHGEVAGATARQVARPAADVLVRTALEAWTPPPATRPYVVRRLPPGGAGLAPAERMRLARHDHVGAMVRRCHVLAHPFPARPFGEDLAWGWTVLRAGLALAYVPTAEVEHSHQPTLWSTFARNRAAHRQARAEFDLIAVPSPIGGALAVLAGVPADLRAGGPEAALIGLPRRAAALLGQWLGAREA